MKSAPPLALAILLALPACDRLNPASVCSSPTVQRDILAMLVGNAAALPQIQRQDIASAIQSEVEFSMVTLDARDDTTGKITCSADVGPSDRSADAERVIYTRQADAGGDGFIYTVGVPYSTMGNGIQISNTLLGSWLASLAARAAANGSDPSPQSEQVTARTTAEPVAKATQAIRPTQPQPVQAELRALISEFNRDAVAAANEREVRAAIANGDPADDAYKFQVSANDLKSVDLDGDGDLDGVLLANLCEENNCHATTESSAVALVRNDDGRLRLASRRVLEGPGEIMDATLQGVLIRTTEFGPDDPSCCASQTRTHRLRLD